MRVGFLGRMARYKSLGQDCTVGLAGHELQNVTIMYNIWRLWDRRDILTSNTPEAQHSYYLHLSSISIYEFRSVFFLLFVL